MKHLILFISVMIFYTLNINAHKQHVHQYLTIEAYKLLKHHLGNDIHEMFVHLDNGSVGPAWTNGTLAAGAWREDEEDVVYGYEGYLLNGWDISIDKWIVSITHFWDADDGNMPMNHFIATIIPSIVHKELGTFPNSYQKLLKFANPYRFIEIRYPLAPGSATFNLAGGGSTTISHSGGVGFEYNSLIEFYTTGRAWLTGYYAPVTAEWVKCNYEIIIPEGNYRNNITWEILGRMCHLLEDLSVPAHAHKDEHGTFKDPYEEFMGADNHHLITDDELFSYSVIDPTMYQPNNPLHFLMYIVQQVSDHYASLGEDYNGDGDDYLGGNGTTVEKNYITTNYPWSSLGKPNSHEDVNNDQYKLNIKNKTYPLVIGATAGLLYWFAKEANILPPPPQPLTVNISGPTYLNNSQNGTFTANATGGKPPYHYQWWYLHPSVILFQSFGIITPNSIPLDIWFTLGTDSPTLSKADTQNFNLKCVVTDADNTQITSNILNVSVGGSLSKTSETDKGGEISKSEKESPSNILTSTEEPPKEYSVENYPNPFNPSTKISFSIPKSGHVSLKVYDILGREVAVLANQIFSSGRYNFEFNANNLPSGTYIYNLVTESKTITKKMLLVK